MNIKNSVSPIQAKKKNVINKTRLNERSKSNTGTSIRGRNLKLADQVSIRSKSNKSRLSNRSSMSCVSTKQRSVKKSLSKKKERQSRSVIQQQIEEYNKFSTKNFRKSVA